MKGFRRIELANAAILAALLLGSLLAWPALPAMLPIHFDSAGDPAYWSQKSLPLWLTPPVVAAGVWLFLRWIVRMAFRSPARWNVPEKERFLGLSGEARAPIERALARHVASTGLVVTLVFTGLQAGIFLVAMGWARNLLWFALPLGIGGTVLILALGWRVRRDVGRRIERAAESEGVGR